MNKDRFELTNPEKGDIKYTGKEEGTLSIVCAIHIKRPTGIIERYLSGEKFKMGKEDEIVKSEVIIHE